MRTKVFWLGLLAAICLGPSCHRGSGEDEIIGTLDRIVSLAENKDLDAVLAFFAEDFGDFEGRDKDGLRSLLASYLDGRTGIVVRRLGTRIIEFRTDRADMEAEVALSSGGAEALRRLVRISPDIYRIRLDLGREEGRWLVRYAEWSSIGLDGLLPESVVKLKKMFPRLWTDR